VSSQITSGAIINAEINSDGQVIHELSERRLQSLKGYEGGECDGGMEFGSVKSVGDKIRSFACECDAVGAYSGHAKRWVRL
jgi:hypothetical protein